jgi:thiol-disulfide isomerase/thioredoxin
MRVSPAAFAIILAFGFGATLTRATECEASLKTRRELRRLYVDSEGHSGDGARLENERIGLEELLQRRPGDVFLHLAYQENILDRGFRARPAMVERYKQLLDQHQGNRDYQFLYANALIDINTPDAIARSKQLISSNPSYTLAHLVLAGIDQWGKFTDRAAMRAEVKAFFDACPASLETVALERLQESADSEMALKYAAPFRARLQRERDVSALASWNVVWNLEFKGTSPAQHDQVRKRLATDLQRLSKIPVHNDPGWLSMLADGYKMVGDSDSHRRMEDRILAEYSGSTQARDIRIDRFSKEHAWPKPEDSDESMQSFYRAMLQMAESGLKASPKEMSYLMWRFEALADLDATTSDQLIAASDALRQAQSNSGSFYLPPIEFQIASAYLKKKIRPEEVPSLVDEGWKSYRARFDRHSDREPDEMTKSRPSQEAYQTIEAARLLLGAAEQLKKPDIAKSAMDQVAQLKPDQPYLQSLVWAAKAKWAELNRKKLAALLMYLEALDTRPPGFRPRGKNKDELSEAYERLWTELGGTPDAKDLLQARNKPAEITTAHEWEKPPKELPAWQLPDLQGKTWKLTELNGKTLLINVWATWCDPCRAEHPFLQKLYEKEKDRTDIQILTFNIDDEIGAVEPYVKENKFTFPVLLARDLVKDLVPGVGIPQNWIVDANGKWLLTCSGFGEGDVWEKVVLEQLSRAGLK